MSELPPVLSTDTVPSLVTPSNQFQKQLKAAKISLQKGSFQGCYEYLVSAIEGRIATDDLKDRDYEELHPILLKFQDALFDKAAYDDIGAWLCPNQKGLLRKLTVHFKKHQQPAGKLLGVLWAGIHRLSEAETQQALELKRDYVEAAYRLAKREKHRDDEQKLIVLLGHTYLDLAKLLPKIFAFDEGYRNACFCFNIADDEIGKKLVEKTFIEQLVDNFDHLPEAAEKYIWATKTPDRTLYVVSLAEQLIAYGYPKAARSLYGEAVRYAQKHRFAAGEAIQNRHLELDNDDVTSQAQDNRKALIALRKLTISEFEEGKHPTIHILQEAHGKRMVEFVGKLYTQAIHLLGPPPCNYSLLGLGSLARGEMGIYSDLDAIVLVEKTSPKIVSFFQDVACYFELLVMNLGETSAKDFLGFSHISDGFCLDPAALHPGRTILTTDQLIDQQEKRLKEIKPNDDIDPITNALRLTCHITGSRPLFENHLAELQVWLTNACEPLGNFLLSRWKAPQPIKNSFDAKQDLYRPITLLIDAFSVKHKVPEVNTCKRLTALKKHLSKNLITLCEKGLELACRLRLQAQIQHGEEIATLDVNLLSYEDWQTLEKIEALLFRPFRQGKDLSEKALEEAQLAYLELLIQKGKMERASELGATDSAPLALWRGEFKLACDLYERSHPLGDEFYVALSPYHRALTAHTPLPNVPHLDELAGHLNFFKQNGYRQIIAPPPRTIFEGSAPDRRAALSHYLTALPLHEAAKKIAWDYALDCFHKRKPLPVDQTALFLALLPLKIKNPTVFDITYSDLIGLLRPILEETHDDTVYSYLFHLFPPRMKRRFLSELRETGMNEALDNELAHFPQADGSRPFYTQDTPPLNLKKFKGESKATLEGTGTKKFSLSDETTHFFGTLIKGKKARFGRHAVAHLDGTYFKLYPEFPGTEYAYCTLQRFVTGSSFPVRQLCKVQIGNKSYPVSASTAVTGKSLQDLLDQSPQIKNLDFRHYCWEVIMTLLALHEDGSPDNYIAHQPHHNDPIQLINIDPDRVFFDPMKKGLLSRNVIQCKSILFCLDQIKLPIDKTVRAEFLTLNPLLFFEHWLKEIDVYNQKCFKLFGSATIDACLQRHPTCAIPFFPEPTRVAQRTDTIRRKGLVLRLIERFKSLQDALRDPTPTSLDLLLHLEPKLGSLYEAQLKGSKSAIERWCRLTEGQYKRLKGSTQSITSTVLRGQHSSIREFSRHGWTIENSREDLKMVISANTSDKTIIDNLITGDGSMLKTLNLPHISDRALKSIDFSKLSKEVQAKVIARITGLQFTRLYLRHCTTLSNSKLEAILKFCPDLATLDLSYSKGVISLAYLSQHCPKLKRLDLNCASTLRYLWGNGLYSKEPLKLPSLRSLDISHNQLSNVNLHCDRLKSLACLGDHLPADFILNATDVTTLCANNKSIVEQLRIIYQPQLIRFRETQIHAIDTFDPLAIAELTAISLHKNSVVYRVGAESITESIACSLGLDLVSIRDPSTHTIVDGRKSNLAYLNENLVAIAKKNPDLKTLNLKKSNQIDGQTVFSTTKQRPALTSLDLSGNYKISGETIQLVVTQCPELRTLRLSGERLSNKTFTSLTKQCKNLTSLGLLGSNKLHAKAISSITSNCPNLTRFELGPSPLDGKVFKHGWSEETKKGAITIAERCSNLNHLSLHSEITSKEFTTIAYSLKKLSHFECTNCHATTTGVTSLATSNPTLTHLSLRYCTDLKDKAIVALAKGCGDLVTLRLDSATKITDNALFAVASGCTNLATLRLFDCQEISDDGITAITKNCTDLASVDLCGCPKLTDRAIINIGSRCKKLMKLKFAYSGDLTATEMMVITRSAERSAHGLGNDGAFEWLNRHQAKKPRATFTDQAVLAIAKHCRSLTELRMGRHHTFGERGINVVAELGRGLCALDLSGKTDLTDEVLLAIVSNSPRLMRLSVSGNLITDKAMMAIAQSCERLANIDLHGCTKLTDQTVIAIATACNKLTFLDLSGCSLVTDKSIIILSEHCHNLSSLNLTNCKQIGDEAITKISKNCPHLAHLTLRGNTKLTERAILALLAGCTGLATLSFGNLGQDTHKVQMRIRKEFPHVHCN
jgi:Putative nucleotidyltransferase substrate binding domain/Putative nucleotidyltransferase DUF294/Leucine Rich repeat